MITKDVPVYEKVGRRYKEVGRWIEFDIYRYRKDNGEPDACLLVFHKEGGTSYLHNVELDKAPVLAAMKVGQEAMLKAMLKASELQPVQQTTQITQEQRDLLDKLHETGFNASNWTRESLVGVIEAGMKAMELQQMDFLSTLLCQLEYKLVEMWEVFCNREECGK